MTSEQNTLKQKSWIDSHTKREVVLLSDVRKWLQQKQRYNWLKGSLGYEIIEELLEDLDK